MFATPFQTDAYKPKTVPAPIGGLNARDSLAAMPETDALIMRNLWPQPYGCAVRNGYIEWATGMPSAVETLATSSRTDGSQFTFAWSDDSIYDVTVQAPVGAPVITGLSSATWETVNQVNVGGDHLICVNGIDDPLIFDTTGWNVVTTGVGPYQWAGIDPTKAVQITVHQSRVWVVERDSSVGWFLAPDAISGTWTPFDFGPLFSRGGFLAYLTTWTIDDGNGAEDHLVGVSSRGEAVVFAGTDPESDTAWSMVGVYYLGAPVAGRRAYTKMGGDLLVLTQQGVVSMTQTLVSTKVSESASKLKTDKIQFLISELTANYGNLSNWQLKYFPKYNMLLINVPSQATGGNFQLASNQLIDAWTQFDGMDAACWITLDASPYFGDYQGRVLRAWFGNSDNVKLDGTGGEGIKVECQQAYSYLGTPATQKQVGLYRPNFVVSSSVAYNSQIVYDFNVLNVALPNQAPPSLGSTWNTATWGSGIWGGGTQVQKPWIAASGMGYAASLKLALQSQTDVLWVATDYSVITGLGIL